jgi:LysM repeat protein
MINFNCLIEEAWMSDLKVFSPIPISLAQKGHCILCGFGPLMVEKQGGQPDRIRCIRCNLALEMDTTRVYMRIVDLPKGLSGDFNPNWMKASTLRKYITELFNNKAGIASIPVSSPVIAPLRSRGSTDPTASSQIKDDIDSAPPTGPSDDSQFSEFLQNFESTQTAVQSPRFSQPAPELDSETESEFIPRWSEVASLPEDQHGRWICPFLKLKTNPAISLAYSSPNNACYKIATPQLVSVSHQEETCLSGRSALCPVMAEGFEGPLPVELRGKPQYWLQLRRIFSRSSSTIAFVLIVAAAVYIFFSSGAASTIAAVLSIYGFPVQALFAAPRSPTLVPILSETATSTIVPQTGSYGQDILLGPEKQYTIHIVLEGETIEILAKTYHMTPEAIKKVNPLVNYGLEPLMVLVLIPGHQNLQDLVPLQAVHIEKEAGLSDLILSYQITRDMFQTYNQILGNQISPGQWLILPYYAKITVLPTDTPTPRPSS